MGTILIIILLIIIFGGVAGIMPMAAMGLPGSAACWGSF
jgi:hypothetical protein